MQSLRLPRFHRSTEVRPVHITARDLEILRAVRRHRFLRSTNIATLMFGSRQQLLRRLQLLFHHGYLERPHAQLDYFHRGGSHAIIYGLGKKGAALLKSEPAGTARFAATATRNPVGRLFLEQALLVSDVMVALESSFRINDKVRLLPAHELPLPEPTRRLHEPFHWSVKFGGLTRLSVVPDRVFGLEFQNASGSPCRVLYFLEADCGTMPVTRHSLAQTSFLRKLLAYEATWSQAVHKLE